MHFSVHTQGAIKKYIICGFIIITIFALLYYKGITSKTSTVDDIQTGPVDQEVLSSYDKGAIPSGVLLVYITGAVEEPGLYEFPEGTVVGTVIQKAGGLLPYGDAKNINMAIKVEDGTHIHIPFNFSGNPEELLRKKKVNLNTSDEKELETLPRVGPALAKRILDYRKEKGAFTSIEQLKEVKGIGDKMFEELSKGVTI